MLPLFPRIPHFADSNATPDDLVMNAADQASLLRAQTWVFEKHDGINAAIGLVGRERLCCELRPPWDRALDGAAARALEIYVRQREPQLRALLHGGRIAYGEWLFYRVSIRYTDLADHLIIFALCEQDGRFLRPPALVRACQKVGLATFQPLWKGRLGDQAALNRRAAAASGGAHAVEGLIVERVGPGAGPRWGKWVAPGYHHVAPGTLPGDRNQMRL